MSDLAMQASEVQLPGDFLERYCRNHSRSFVSSLLLSSLLAIAMWNRVSGGPLLAWLALVLLSQAAQVWHARSFLQARLRCTDWKRNWFPGFLVGSVSTGLSWGISFFLLGLSGFDPVAVLLIFSLAGVTAYAAIAKSHVFLLAFSFELGALLPMVAWLLMLDGNIPRIMGFIALLYLGLLYVLLRQVGAMTRHATVLQEENFALSAALRKVRMLEREGAMFRGMFEMIADPAVVVHDPRDDNRIIYANDAACRHFGADRETLLTWRPADFDTRITPEKGQLLRDALQKRGKFAFQSAHRRADGQEVPVEVVINMFRHEGSELMVTFVRNISSRLAADERLHELELAAVRQEGDQRIGRYLECVPGLFFTLRRGRDGAMSMPFACGSSPSFQGLSPEVVADSIEPLLALCHPDDVDPLLSELHASALEKRPCQAEFRIGDMSQRQMVMELSAQPQPSATDPGVMEWHGFMHDVTKRKELEEQLKMKGGALDHSSEAVFLADDKGRFVYVNEQACHSLGYSREELLMLGIPDIDPAFPMETLQDRHGKVKASGGGFTFETSHHRRDGSSYPVEIRASEVEFGGRVLSLSLVRDITERKRAEIALAAREQEFRSLAESAPDNIVRYDREGCLRYLNERLLRHLGLASMDEAVGKRPDEVWPDGRFSKLEEAAARVVASGERVELELTEPDGKGGWLYHLISVVAERDEQGEIVGTIAFGRNVTHLRSTERLMQMIGDHLPGAVTQYRWRSDLSGELLYASQGLQALCGITKEELADGLGPMIALIHPDDLPKAVAEQEHAAKTLTTAVSEFRMNHPEKGEIWVQQITTPVPESEASQLWYSLMFDITERKHLEIALAARAAEFRSLAENSPDPIYRYDRDCRRIYANRAVERLTGKAREDLLGKSPLEFVPNPSVNAIKAQQCIQRVLDQGEPCKLEVNFTAANGLDVAIHNVFVPEFSVDGSVQSVLCIGRDITGIKKAEQALAERERFLESLLDAIPVPVFYKDREGRYLGINRAFEHFFGANREQLIGKSVFDTHPKELAETYHAKDVEVFERKVELQQYEFQIKHSNGTLRDVFFSKAAFSSAQGEVKGLIGAVIDITERKQAECELQRRYDEVARLNDRLEENARLLEEQTVEMEAAQDQLKQTEAWYRGILQSAPDGMMILDDRGRITQVNAELARMFGYEPRELVGQAMEVLVPADMHAAHTGMRDKYIKNPDRSATPRLASNLRACRKDGGEFFVDVTLSYLPENEYLAGSVCAAVRDVSERRRAEQALNETRLRLHSVVRTIPDMVWMKDAEGVYLSCNHAFERFFGAEEVAIVGKTDYDFVEASLADFFRQKDMEAIEAKAVRVNEEWITYADDGRRALLETRKVPVFDADGEVTGVLGVARDITERKRMENELRKKECEFRTLVENVNDVVVRYDRDCRRSYVNPAWERVNGISAADAVGKSPQELAGRIKPMSREFETMLREVMETQCSRTTDLVWDDEAGRQVCFQIEAVPEFDGSGEVAGVLTVARDITERKRMEAALALREQEFRALAENAPDIIMRYDLDCRRTYVNPAFVRQIGLPAEKLLGGTPTGYSTSAQAIAYEQALRRVLQSGESCEHEYTWQTVYGVEITSLFNIVPEQGADGRLISVLAIGRDITERKRMEAALALREQEFRTLVENAADTVARYGTDMRRLYANPAFAKLLDGGLDALLGKKPSEAPGGSQMEVYEEKLAEVLAQGREVEFELEWSGKAGHEICSLISLTPEFGKDGKVVSVLAVGRDISELNVFRRKIHQMAFYDTLTSLPNRALFNDRLRQMLTDASWHGQLAGVMMLDMDRFKAVNDTMGHAVGDELLRETGARLSACVRSYDTVARLGGDEFAILLPDVRNAEDLGRVADKLRTAFDTPFMLEGKEVFVSCSIGIALYPNDSDAADDLLKYADSAMYLAKRSGRNNFRFYSKDLTNIANERLMLESDLRRAVGRNELELYYQPKVSLEDGTVMGSEALLRWHHPRLGMVPPNQFIEIAEDSGLIVEIGEWILREACRTAAEWNAPGKPLHKVAINLSARQFQAGSLVSTVYRALEETACYPEWIELEITESLLLDEDGRVLEVLNAFRSMGITIAIDDFGTGYSALSYLARFPIDTLKIDRSFIRSITEENYRAELVKAILSIARSLGQQVVAEGVETVEQAAFLQAHGCRVVQGFLFSKPLPKDELAALPHAFYSVREKMEGVPENA